MYKDFKGNKVYLSTGGINLVNDKETYVLFMELDKIIIHLHNKFDILSVKDITL